MFLDNPPPSRKKIVDRKMIQKLKKGGMMGNAIREKREEHHSEVELPEAEKNFESEIASIQNNNSDNSNEQKEVNSIIKKSFIQKIIDFFRSA